MAIALNARDGTVTCPLDPSGATTIPATLFAASIVHDAQTGDMIVSCSPELAPAEAAKRTYSVYGKANLTDPDWTLLGTGLPWRASGNSDYHFFRVTVEMR